MEGVKRHFENPTSDLIREEMLLFLQRCLSEERIKSNLIVVNIGNQDSVIEWNAVPKWSRGDMKQ